MDVDSKDKKILYELEYNARKPFSEIARNVKIPKQVVGYRIKKMTENGVIRGFRALVDTHRLGYFSYRIYIRFQNVTPENENALFRKLSNWKNVLWIIAITGRWDLEIVLVARNS